MNERSVRIERGCLGQALRMEAHFLGEDVAVLISGGSRPHIGSVSAAFFQGGAAEVRTSEGAGHRDGVVSEAAARRLCEALGRNCSVCCGIHYDAASREDIRLILTETDDMLAELLARLRGCAAAADA